MSCSFQAKAREPKLYPLDDGVTASTPDAIVRVQRGFTGPGIFLVSFDGKDPRSFPSMAEYADKVRRSEAALKPGQFSLLPGRNERQMIGVAPGAHAFGVMFEVIDIARGLLGNKIAHSLARKYMAEGALSPDDRFITAKHYEELTFSAQSGKRYLINYTWNKEAVAVAFTVSECPESWNDCSPIPFESAKAVTTVQPGANTQDIEKKTD